MSGSGSRTDDRPLRSRRLSDLGVPAAGGGPMTVAGLDLSITSTGLARIYPDGRFITDAIGARPSGSTTADQALRLSDLSLRISQWLRDDDSVLVEGMAFAAGKSYARDIAGLWWMVVSRLVRRDIRVSVAPPTVLKKWATGKGNAGKELVALHIGRLYPTADVTGSDELDALALAHMAACRAGYDVPTRAHHNEQIWRSVEWQA